VHNHLDKRGTAAEAGRWAARRAHVTEGDVAREDGGLAG
jgi:hypothetical protein